MIKRDEFLSEQPASNVTVDEKLYTDTWTSDPDSQRIVVRTKGMKPIMSYALLNIHKT